MVVWAQALPREDGVSPEDSLPGAGGEELSDDQQELLWYLWEDRSGRTGASRRTKSMAEKALGWKWHRVRDVLAELLDAGRLEKFDDYGHYSFPQNAPEPLNPKPFWVDPEDPSASLGRAPRRRLQASPARVTTSQRLVVSSLRTPPSGEYSVALPDDSKIPMKVPRWVYAQYGRETYQLVDYFLYRVGPLQFGRSPEPINKKVLSSSIRRWIIEGLDPLVIKAMIDLFAKEAKFLKKGIPAWKSFLASRQYLVTNVLGQNERKTMESRWKREGR